jgi:hypothetical protein
MLERSWWDMKDSMPDERLAAVDRIWSGSDRTLLGARRAADRIAVELERWTDELESERSDLCCTILGIEIGDNVVYPRGGQITRLSVTRTSLMVNEEKSVFIIEGTRFRKDGTAGKRSEVIWIDFVQAPEKGK